MAKETKPQQNQLSNEEISMLADEAVKIELEIDNIKAEYRGKVSKAVEGPKAKISELRDKAADGGCMKKTYDLLKKQKLSAARFKRHVSKVREDHPDAVDAFQSMTQMDLFTEEAA